VSDTGPWFDRSPRSPNEKTLGCVDFPAKGSPHCFDNWLKLFPEQRFTIRQAHRRLRRKISALVHLTVVNEREGARRTASPPERARDE
jgi:hypothetical protein